MRRQGWMLGLLVVGLLAGCASQPQPHKIAYVGTYTGDSGSKGIYRIHVDKEKGVVGKPELVAEAGNPSFLAFNRDKKYLYAVSETESKVFAYDVKDKSAPLTLLNEAKTGRGPCHVASAIYWVSPPPSRVSEMLAVADYMGGSAGAWLLEEDGRIGKQDAFFQNTHASEATGRQQQPHAHGVTFFDGLLLLPDLGADRVYVYKHNFNKMPNTTPHATAPWIELPPGRGPRHVAFSPPLPANYSGRYRGCLYVLNELSNTVSVFEYNSRGKTFTFIEEVGTLPAGFDGQNTTAELIVLENTLYATNRGHDSIARFKRDPSTGRLTLLDCTPCGGKWPRHFTIMPGSSLMLVANQHSNNIAVFRIGKDGSLTPIPGGGVEIGAPACVVFE